MVVATKSYRERWATDQVEECSALWNLTDEEKGKLWQLREHIEDVDSWKNEPFEVVRFLKEFKFHLKTTEQKFRASIQWRLENNADTILEDYQPPALFNFFPMAVIEGADYDGDPVYIERSGVADSLDLLKRFGRDEMIKQAIWGRELMSRGPWQNDWPHHNGRIRNFTAILDLKGLNRSHLSPSLVPVGQEVTRLVQDNYPGSGKKILIIRAPYFFRFVWSIFKHFVDPHVKDLMEIATEKESEEVLAKYMDLRILPKEIVPGEGKGRAIRGYDPVWEGGPLPPSGKDDWKRRVPVFGPDHQSCYQETTLDHTQASQDAFVSPTKTIITETNRTTASPVDNALHTPLQRSASVSSISSTSSRGSNDWEILPSRPQRKNIQQAWTVTPAPICDLEEVWKEEHFSEMAGLWKLTPDQQTHMKELRDRLADVHHIKNDPFEVVRYYKQGKADNLDRIEHSFREMVTWRVENNMDDYLRQYGQPNPLFYRMPMCILKGRDKEGDPIALLRLGASDYKSLLKKFGEDKLVGYALFLRELNSTRRFWKSYEEKTGHRFKQYTMIIDLDGLNSGHVKPGMLHILRRIVKIFSENYGGYSKRILVIQAGGVFKLSWALIRNLFSSQTREKILISGDDHLSFLDKYIDRAVLPPLLCPEDGVGETMAGYYENINLEGGKIPKAVLKMSKAQFPAAVPVFPVPTQQVTSMDSDPVLGTPVSTRKLLTGYWGGVEDRNDVDGGTPIRAFATPEKAGVSRVLSKKLYLVQ